MLCVLLWDCSVCNALYEPLDRRKRASQLMRYVCHKAFARHFIFFEVLCHAVKRIGKLSDLIPGADSQAYIEIPLGQLAGSNRHHPKRPKHTARENIGQHNSKRRRQARGQNNLAVQSHQRLFHAIDLLMHKNVANHPVVCNDGRGYRNDGRIENISFLGHHFDRISLIELSNHVVVIFLNFFLLYRCFSAAHIDGEPWRTIAVYNPDRILVGACLNKYLSCNLIHGKGIIDIKRNPRLHILRRGKHLLLAVVKIRAPDHLAHHES